MSADYLAGFFAGLLVLTVLLVAFWPRDDER